MGSSSRTPVLCFTDEDRKGLVPGHIDPLVVSGILANTEVSGMFVGLGCGADIIYLNFLKKLGFTEKDLTPVHGVLMDFASNRVTALGSIQLLLTLGKRPSFKSINVKFLVVDSPNPAFNIILGRPSILEFGAEVSTAHQCMKFVGPNNEVVTVRGDKVTQNVEGHVFSLTWLSEE